jgi:hypothetical protein
MKLAETKIPRLIDERMARADCKAHAMDRASFSRENLGGGAVSWV